MKEQINEGIEKLDEQIKNLQKSGNSHDLEDASYARQLLSMMLEDFD